MDEDDETKGKATAALQARNTRLTADRKALAKYIADTSGTDVSKAADLDGVTKKARLARGGKVVARKVGETAGGVLHGLGLWGKVAACIVGLAGTTLELFGVAEGRGAGRRAVDTATGVGGGLLGATASTLTAATIAKVKSKRDHGV